MPVVNAYNLHPDEVEPGQVMIFTVKLMVTGYKIGGKTPTYRIYRCPYHQEGDEREPQGTRIPKELEKAVAKALFPVVTYECKPDPSG